MTLVCETQGYCIESETTAEGQEQWRGPNGFSLLAWEVDFRARGTSRLHLRSAEGREHWVEGVRLEIAEPERVVFRGDFGFGSRAVTFRRD